MPSNNFLIDLHRDVLFYIQTPKFGEAFTIKLASILFFAASPLNNSHMLLAERLFFTAIAYVCGHPFTKNACCFEMLTSLP